MLVGRKDGPKAMISLSPLSAVSLSSTKLILTPCYNINNNYFINTNQRSIRNKTCKAGITQEAPVVVGIGACILNSLVFPLTPERDDEDENENESPVIDSTDARMAVMGIISLIPYFNWLSWVFAWLDTGKQRYIVYSLVYLAPYLRTSLSISPQESWLPISSIILGVIHMQLEASVRNGELQEFQIFRGFAKNYSVTGSKKSPYQGRDRVSEEEQERINLPSTRDQSRNDVQGWGVPEKPSINPEKLNEDGNSSKTRKH